MEHEAKQEVKKEEKQGEKNLLGNMVKVVIGLVLLVLGGLSLLKWWPELLILVRGAVGLFFILAGIITLAIAKE